MRDTPDLIQQRLTDCVDAPSLETNCAGIFAQRTFDGTGQQITERDFQTDLLIRMPGVLGQELRGWQPRIEEQVPSGEVRRAHSTAFIALIFSAPLPIRGTWDLAERIKLKEKIERLIAWTKARSPRREVDPFPSKVPDGSTLPPGEAVTGQSGDAFTAHAAAPEDKTG